jgi:hypothetical protein
VEVDEEKIREEEIYDGKYVLLTNSDLSAEEVAFNDLLFGFFVGDSVIEEAIGEGGRRISKIKVSKLSLKEFCTDRVG